jgi:hypothetical protein
MAFARSAEGSKEKRPDSNTHMFLLDIFTIGWEDIEFLSHLTFAGRVGLQKTA